MYVKHDCVFMAPPTSAVMCVITYFCYICIHSKASPSPLSFDRGVYTQPLPFSCIAISTQEKSTHCAQAS